MNAERVDNPAISGEFLDLERERYYAIRNVDQMAPFLISVISSVDHWLFLSSNGGLSAGRVSPATALFPYITADKIYDSPGHTGPKSVVRVRSEGHIHYWEPFNREHDARFSLRRNLYKNLLGNKLCFEEINQDLQLLFRYTWASSDAYGFVRRCELQNLGTQSLQIDLIDGFQNLLPAGTPRFAQTNSSNLVDAYKWSELHDATGLALFTLSSGITDRAEPSESLKANTVFCLGMPAQKVLLSSDQLAPFRAGGEVSQETLKRGLRGAYLVGGAFQLAPQGRQQWQLVANVEQSQAQVVALLGELGEPTELADAVARSVEQGSDRLARIMASGDGFQSTAEESVAVHHYANVVFNILRGGVFFDQYNISGRDFAQTIELFNRAVYRRHQRFLSELPERVAFETLQEGVKGEADPQLERLCQEYLPITFGRRHGDPSRPWNQFAIRVKDEHGNQLLSYQGNWRDIFQNWEALAFSYPELVENMIAKFVNASTVDGYNPYRITKEGIDWEVEEPDNPWSYIGYWGDHQIIYLLELLELSRQFHPNRLSELLARPIFSYANVPYRIRPFDELVEDPKRTVDYDEKLAETIEHRVARMGVDGKLVLDEDREVYQVNLLEKLLIPLLAKLGNLVMGGGIWLNTQRPEWNDANNALVGQGLSMVTLYYMRRYLRFLQQLLAKEQGSLLLSIEVGQWLADSTGILEAARGQLERGANGSNERYPLLEKLGRLASRYRHNLYRQGAFSGTAAHPFDLIRRMLESALVVIDESIGSNRRIDGLYHAYNILKLREERLDIDPLYPMLEGQVAVLSSGALSAQQAISLLEALFDSDLYRPDQQSFILYPDRELPSFLAKGVVSSERVAEIPLLQRMLAAGDERIVLRDCEGRYRFSAEFTNVRDMDAELSELAAVYGEEVEAAREALRSLYEEVFNHRAFTGRSGTMFGFEGLGCIYWHMVAKLLLAVQRNYFSALESGASAATCHRLGELYYRVRQGIGFNKTPLQYGAFPTDPYSHTPKHAGAQQPGMTGQVKEEIRTRFGELGVQVRDGMVRFAPTLLRAREFRSEPGELRYLDVAGNWCTLAVPAAALAFTWCQVPVLYLISDAVEPRLTVSNDQGESHTYSDLLLPAELSSELFRRSGRIRQLAVTCPKSLLFAD